MMTTPEPHAAPLYDVSNIPFEELLASDNVNLAATIQRLVKSLDDPNGIISAFQSFASD